MLEDVTDVIHPRVAAQCIRAARVIGIDVAGLDVVTEDISQPLEARGGVILEINADPAIGVHYAPQCDRPRPICDAILDHLFPNGGTGRAPTVVVSGYGDLSRVGWFLEKLLSGRTRRIGRASSRGLYVAGERIKADDSANAGGARAVLLCPEVELAILEQSLDRVRHEGLCIDLCDAAILADARPTSARNGASSSQDDVRAAAVLFGAVSPEGAIVIDGMLPPSLAPSGSHPRGPFIVGPVSRKGRAAVDSDTATGLHVDHRREAIVWSSSRRSEAVIPLPPALVSAASSRKGLARDLLRAVAAALALRLSTAEIQAGLAIVRPGSRRANSSPLATAARR
jgi:cyanophycin synthetase